MTPLFLESPIFWAVIIATIGLIYLVEKVALLFPQNRLRKEVSREQDKQAVRSQWKEPIIDRSFGRKPASGSPVTPTMKVVQSDIHPRAEDQPFPVMRAQAYKDKLNRVTNSAFGEEGMSYAEKQRFVGNAGETILLKALEQEGRGVFYWSVGLSKFGKKAEYDILAITKSGILHIEVKHFHGNWSPALDEPMLQPYYWSKLTRNRRVKKCKSPISQALRGKRLLEEALGIVCRKDIPVTSVVVFTGNNFSMSGIEDDRLPYFIGSDSFMDFFRSFVDGKSIDAILTDKDAATIASYLGNANQEPVFFDSQYGSEHQMFTQGYNDTQTFREAFFELLMRLGLTTSKRPPEGSSNFFCKAETLSPNQVKMQ